MNKKDKLNLEWGKINIRKNKMQRIQDLIIEWEFGKRKDEYYLGRIKFIINSK